MRSQIMAVDSYVAFDFETTGLRTVADEILEIGAVMVVDGEVADTFKTLCRPVRHDSWPDDVGHGIRPETVEGAPSPKDACEDMLRWSEGLPLVGHNAAGFDSVFLTEALGHEPENELIDTMRIIRKLGDVETHSLGGVYDLAVSAGCRPVDAKLGQAHRALYDAGMTVAVYEYLKPRIPEIKVKARKPKAPKATGDVPEQASLF